MISHLHLVLPHGRTRTVDQEVIRIDQNRVGPGLVLVDPEPEPDPDPILVVRIVRILVVRILVGLDLVDLPPVLAHVHVHGLIALAIRATLIVLTIHAVLTLAPPLIQPFTVALM